MPSPQPIACAACGTRLAADVRFCGVCGSAVGGSTPREVGRTIAGRYRILAKLGEGGMGAVYRAEQLSLHREVALKVLKPELSGTQTLVRRFNAEAELAARLNHPNTVTLFDFGQDDDGSLFIAMELVQGRSLRQLLAGGALPIDVIVHIAEQVCSSLSDAHGHGIVHRDLKPDNIMLTRRGKDEHIVRVLDFGIAKLREDGRITKNPMTQAGDLLGTPQYMAPEQVRAERVDARVDVYAMGCMLYEMVTGRLPFIGPTVMAILSKHLTDAPIPPRQLRPELPPALETAILRAMAKRAEDRPATMDELAALLSACRPVAGGMGPESGRAPSSAPIAGAVVQPAMPASAAGEPVHAPHPTPATPGTPPTGPGMGMGYGPTATAAPTPSDLRAPAGSPAKKRLLWIALAVVLVAGGAAAAVLLTQRSDSGALPTDFDTHSLPTHRASETGEPGNTGGASDTGEPGDTAPPSSPDETLPSDFQTRPVRDVLGGFEK